MSQHGADEVLDKAHGYALRGDDRTADMLREYAATLRQPDSEQLRHALVSIIAECEQGLLHSTDTRYLIAQTARNALLQAGMPTAEPVAQVDQVEFALRDAGFDLDDAATLAERVTAEPVAQPADIGRVNLPRYAIVEEGRLTYLRRTNDGDLCKYADVHKSAFFAALVAEKAAPPAQPAAHGEGMLPDALIAHADEWYRLCERRFSVDRMTISGKLAEAIVEATAAPPAQPAARGEAVAWINPNNETLFGPMAKAHTAGLRPLGYIDDRGVRAQPAERDMIGRMVSVDVSTGEHDAEHRIFAQIIGENGVDLDGKPNPFLAVMTEDNQPAEPAAHPDDRAVDAFAAAMKAKLTAAREKGRGGWQDKDDCPQQRLSDMLRAHVAKGDPCDVANFAMFLHQRGEAILPAPLASPARVPDGNATKVLSEFLRFVSLILDGAKQSKSNPNAGFVDWRDLCALRGDIGHVRSVLVAQPCEVPDGLVERLEKWCAEIEAHCAERLAEEGPEGAPVMGQEYAARCVRSMLAAPSAPVENAGVPDGYVLVPREPTPEMQQRGAHADLSGEVRELVEAASQGVIDGTGRLYFESGHKADNFRRALAALAKFHPTHQEKP